MTVVQILVALILVWVLICAWCGYRAQFVRFWLVMLSGLSLNACWMVLGLRADPFSGYAMMAHMSGLLFALSSFGVGWIIGRFVRQWRSGRVDGA